MYVLLKHVFVMLSLLFVVVFPRIRLLSGSKRSVIPYQCRNTFSCITTHCEGCFQLKSD
jgi:hypothetical protein